LFKQYLIASHSSSLKSENVPHSGQLLDSKAEAAGAKARPAPPIASALSARIRIFLTMSSSPQSLCIVASAYAAYRSRPDAEPVETE
jgi:hypothetical protein